MFILQLEWRNLEATTMGKLSAVLVVIMICALSATGEKQKGITNLKDVQPAGTTDKKYDFIFEASGMHYTCRTSYKNSVKVTDFVVGTDVNYEINGQKGKLKNTRGKNVDCTVVRVEKLPASPSAPPN
jgi:hypothetical protein